MNYFFGKHFTNKTCLKSFAIQYENDIAKLRDNESSDEYRSVDKVIEPFSNLEIEKQYLDFYTLNMFFKFQKEVKALANVCCVVKSEFGDCLIYEVIDDGVEEEDYKFKIFFLIEQTRKLHVYVVFLNLLVLYADTSFVSLNRRGLRK
jgi:hypothetical protein